MSNWPSAKYNGVRDLPLPYLVEPVEIELFDGNEHFEFEVLSDREIFDCYVEGSHEFSSDDHDDVAEKIASQIYEEVIANGSLSEYIRNLVDEALENYDYEPDIEEGEF